MKKVLKVIWFIIAWPCILGWKVFKFLLKNPVCTTTVGGKDTGGGALVSLVLGVFLLAAIPVAVWLGVFIGVPATIAFGVEHFRGNHNPAKNFVCRWFGEKVEEKVQPEEITESSEDAATPTANTNSVEESVQPTSM